MRPHSRLLHITCLSTVLACGSQATSAADDAWAFSVAPLYLWGKSIEASATAGGSTLPLDLTFKDEILENLDAAFALHLEASKGALTLFAEYNYAKLKPTAEAVFQAGEARVDVDFKDIMAEGGLTWAFAESAAMRWEVLGGLRYYKQDVETKLTLSVPDQQSTARRWRTGDSWVHPFAGVRLRATLGEKWMLRLRGDYGYEDSDNSGLQGIATIDYRFREWGSAFFGYRYYDMDYNNSASGLDQYGFDGKQRGPLIGLNLHF